MHIHDLLHQTVMSKSSDLHLTVGVPAVIRKNGNLEKIGESSLSSQEIEDLTKQMLSQQQLQELQNNGELDFAYSHPEVGRYRVNIFKQKGTYGAAIRVIVQEIPTMEQLGLPQIFKELASKHRGMILVTGPTGSGKSTTLASMIDYMNKERDCHILTLEDPIEYIHHHKKSIVNQREIGIDSRSFSNALRAALRQDPDVILVGEMRDLETIEIALTAAETGHLVLSTLHTIGAAKTVDRIVDVFPPHQQQQIRVQLASILEGIVSQQLLPRANGQGRVAAQEIMVGTPAIRNLIREGKTHQLQTSIQTGAKFGMKTMDNSLGELYRQGSISKETALSHAIEREMLERYIGL